MCLGLYIHYGNYPWQPAMTPACCVSTELASQEGHGPRTVSCHNALCCLCVCVHARACVYLCLRSPATGIPYKYNKLFFLLFLSLPLTLFILSASICDWVLGVMLGLCSCKHKHLSISTWRQTGGHYQAEGQTLHSIFNYKITPLPPPHWHSGGEMAACKRTDALFAVLFVSFV